LAINNHLTRILAPAAARSSRPFLPGREALNDRWTSHGISFLGPISRRRLLAAFGSDRRCSGHAIHIIDLSHLTRSRPLATWRVVKGRFCPLTTPLQFDILLSASGSRVGQSYATLPLHHASRRHGGPLAARAAGIGAAGRRIRGRRLPRDRSSNVSLKFANALAESATERAGRVQLAGRPVRSPAGAHGRPCASSRCRDRHAPHRWPHGPSPRRSRSRSVSMKTPVRLGRRSCKRYSFKHIMEAVMSETESHP
jgi:hypothetical protein